MSNNNRNKNQKYKRMTREMAMSFMPNVKCSFKSCNEIADYTTPFDGVSFLPIETDAILKICVNHKGIILKDFPEAKFKKIPFVDGVHRKVICQACGNSWVPEAFKYGLVGYRKLPKSCWFCHRRAWQFKQSDI